MRSSVLLLLAVRIQTDLAALPVEAAPPGTGRMVGDPEVGQTAFWEIGPAVPFPSNEHYLAPGGTASAL